MSFKRINVTENEANEIFARFELDKIKLAKLSKKSDFKREWYVDEDLDAYFISVNWERPPFHDGDHYDYLLLQSSFKTLVKCKRRIISVEGHNIRYYTWQIDSIATTTPLDRTTLMMALIQNGLSYASLGDTVSNDLRSQFVLETLPQPTQLDAL